MKQAFLFTLLFLAIQARAADSVRILDVSTLTTISGLTNLSHSLVTETSGDATTEATAAKIYVPIATTSTTVSTVDYYYLNTQAGPNRTLFAYTANGASKATYESYYVTFPLVVSVDTNAKYLYAAAKSASSYVIVAKYADQINPVVNGQINFNVSPQSICAGAAAAATNCANFDDNAPATVTEGERIINTYFFVSATSLSVGADIGTPPATGDYSGGVYFQVKMSNQINKNTQVTVTLNSLRKGDGRVVGIFSNSSTITTNYKGAYAYLHSNSNDSCVSIREPGRCQGAFTASSVATGQNGDFTLSSLKNDVPVTVSIGLLNKYGFSTVLSNSISATPTKIQELLKKQACFILTAGFGEEHYITDYFRHYRDGVLAHSWLGRQLIRAYYQSAPHYALIIYQSETLRFAVRSMAYSLYFFFNYSWLVLVFLASLFFLNLRKNKVSLSKNRL